MDARRKVRYRDKLFHIQERLGDVSEWLREAEDDRRSRLAVYKAFQEAAEAVSDIAAMMAADSARQPKDDYTNLELAASAGAIDPKRLAALTETIGLRNRLVHEYNGLDDPRALEAIERLTPEVGVFLEEVERWLNSLP